MSKKPIASNGYIAIYNIDYGINDHVDWSYGESGQNKIHRSRIYYTKTSGRAYFKQNGVRRYLDEFFKIGGY